MLGLTTLGLLHTAVSLVAVAAGALALLRQGAITGRTQLGQVYVITTVITCLTGFGIFQHGGFGKPHALGLLTLIVLALAWWMEHGAAASAWARIVATVAYSASFLFHLIPAITETSTRLPLGAPLLASAEAPELKAATGVLALLFLAGAAWQVLRMRRSGTAPA